jgi:multiple sugar transport system ATP-binding protein
VARLDPASRIAEGENARLWVDVRKLHVFDPVGLQNLTLGEAGPRPAGPAATGGASGAGGAAGGQAGTRPGQAPSTAGPASDTGSR